MRKQSPEFDSRNYGYAKLSDLIEVIGLYEIKCESNSVLVRRKEK